MSSPIHLEVRSDGERRKITCECVRACVCVCHTIHTHTCNTHSHITSHLIHQHTKHTLNCTLIHTHTHTVFLTLSSILSMLALSQFHSLALNNNFTQHTHATECVYIVCVVCKCIVPGKGVFSGSAEVNHCNQSRGYCSNELAIPMKLANLIKQ